LNAAKDLPEAPSLGQEPLQFQANIAASAHDTYGAWREGAHDTRGDPPSADGSMRLSGKEGAEWCRLQIVAVKLTLVDPQKLKSQLARSHLRHTREMGGRDLEKVIDFVVGPCDIVPHMLYRTEVGPHT
jgi:hypothetical protein